MREMPGSVVELSGRRILDLRRSGVPRLRAAEKARRHIQFHFAERIRLADLCAIAGVRPRALEYGFRELTGLSPLAYLRLTRLTAVRAQLQSAVNGARDISEIALDTGFSHISQFVVDYKRAFGETPSVTRLAAREMLQRV